MLKVILTKGLPGSGKSTWAKAIVAKNPNSYKRVNKDSLRAMLDAGHHTDNMEKFIEKARDQLILLALEEGKHVIVDDTNFSPRHQARIEQLVKGKAVVSVKDFTHVPVETCIKNDLNRLESVGEAVIRRMYKQFILPTPKLPEIEFNPDLPKAIMVDMDGTLAIIGDRDVYAAEFCEIDILNQAVHEVILGFQALNPDGHVILCSARQEKDRAPSERWLKANNVKYNLFIMRETGDKRKDFIVKEELYNTHIKDKYNVSYILDDRAAVVEFWRSIGLPCFQVAPGDF